MKGDLMNVQFWLWGQDVLRGDLLARGFAKSPQPDGRGSSLYRKGPLGLHSAVAWLESSEGVLVYVRAKHTFFQVDSFASPPALPVDARRVEHETGLTVFLPYVLEHERWVLATYGGRDREKLGGLPPNARKDLPAWERRVAREVAGGVLVYAA